MVLSEVVLLVCKELIDDAKLGCAEMAFKVTFTLYDSRGIIRNGRTFTHIVLVGG